jgi:tetraacyldisaccharide 4'-kinase
MEIKLNRAWYGDDPVPLWIRLLVPIYRLANLTDRWVKTRRQPEDLKDACILVVGNITVGGAGKTPLVIRLCRVLRAAGLNPGVVSRGYGRREKELRLVSPDSEAATVGDEPLLIARQASVPVMVSNDRCEAARKLLKQGVDVVLSDDGLQHYRLPRRLEICVVDGVRCFGNGRLLPAGPLREPLDRLDSVDFIVVNGESDVDLADRPAVTMNLAPGLLRSLDSGQTWRLSQFAGCRVNAVAGIANPGRFFDLLRHARITPIEYAFPDHHDYHLRDFENMDPNLPVLMTEKDAVKASKLGLKNAWSLDVDAVLPRQWETELLARVMEKNK